MTATPTTADSPAPKSSYVPQLDSLRAFAVAAVVVYHFADDGFGVDLGAWASAGVHLFFVMSGFLITGILLRSRARAEESGEGYLGVLRRFYARRALRIFPLYYLVVGAALVLAVEPAREIAVWLLTYTLNLRMAHQGWYEANFAHFWSLAVEEQFYVFWPCIVLFCAKRHLLRAAIAMALVSPSWKLAYVFSDYTLTTGIGTYISTLACLDALGAGAVLAILAHADPSGATWRRGLHRIAVPLAAVVVAVSLFGPWKDFGIVCHASAEAVLFVWIIDAASRATGGVAGAVLGLRPLQYVGRISYGVYVYHPLVPGILVWLAARLGIARWPHGWLGSCVSAAASLAIAAASWRFFEKPINDLKRHFEDPPARVPPKGLRAMIATGSK